MKFDVFRLKFYFIFADKFCMWEENLCAKMEKLKTLNV